MNRHPADRELIDCRFGLAEERLCREVTAHLEGCADCRRRLEILTRSLSRLDILREEMRVPDRLVSQVVEESRKPRPAPRTSYRRIAWFGAAVAAAALIAAVIRMSVPPGQEEPQPAPAARPPSPPEESMAKARSTPPFLPGSSIELVTLPRRDNVQLTIYNAADLTLVREKRSLTMKKGWNWLQFMWANTLIDPTSLSLEPVGKRDKVSVEQLVFPPRTKQLGRWLIFSEISGEVPFEMTYFTSGVSWRAFYMGTLSRDEKTMRLQGYVRVANGSGEDYENAQTRLIVGRLHVLEEIADLARRPYPYGKPGGSLHGGWDYSGVDKLLFQEEIRGKLGARSYHRAGLARPKEITKEGLSEYFLYTIEGTETIPNGWGKRLPSFEAADIPVESLYKYDEERWGAEPVRFVAFANDEKHKLGQTPLPDGRIRIYGLADDEGHMSYVGGADVKYIPVAEKVELNLGPARYVTVEPRLMDFKTANHMFDAKGNLIGWDEIRQWKIEVKNTRTIPAKVEITRGFGTPHWTMRTDGEIPHEKHDAAHARFTLQVLPRSATAVTYTVTTYHGRREER